MQRALYRPLRAVFIVFISCLLAAGSAHQGRTASVQCDSYKMDLVGTSVMQGVSYTEHLVLEKVKKSGSAQGQWKMVAFGQTTVYPWQINLAIDRVDRVDFGYGMWAKVHSWTAGNVVRTEVLETNAVFDVVGKRIGYRKTNVWCGTISGRDVTFKFHKENPVEPVLKGRLVLAGEKLQVTITSPRQDDRFVFSESSPGVLTFTATASVSPKQYADQLVWKVEPVDGSNMTVEPADAKGARIKVTYTKLPTKNSAFGYKKISASLRVEDCEVAASCRVRIFFPFLTKNNPGGTEPNWFYYWQQTSARVGPVKYGGNTGQCSGIRDRILGYYRNTIFDSVYYICDLSKFGANFAFMAKQNIGDEMKTVKVTGIDTFAVSCRHENAHYTHYQTWWKQYRTADKFKDTNRNGILDDKEEQLDKDGDLVPDALEPGLGLKPNNANTYGIGPDGNDEEFLCWMAETTWKPGSADKEDWAKPGKQWP